MERHQSEAQAFGLTEMEQSENDGTSWIICCCRSKSTPNVEVQSMEIETHHSSSCPEASTSSPVPTPGEKSQAKVLATSSVDGQLPPSIPQSADECHRGLVENSFPDEVFAELATKLAGHTEATTISTVESSIGEACSCSSENTPCEVASQDICHEEQESVDDALRPTSLCEAFLVQMLTHMDFNLRQIRTLQQWLVFTVESACRNALRGHFKELSLVGSVALCVETPGSDVDVVCLTQSCNGKNVALPGDCLRRIREALHKLLRQNPLGESYFSLKLIEDARVPILRAIWGPEGCGGIAVDVLVDQRRPLDHVSWFQRVNATPAPSFPAPPVMSLVTVTLRCVKWWLRQRQLPPTKEGGLPTLVWLLLALRSLTLAGRGPDCEQPTQPMIHLADSLATFFHTYAARDGLDGVLMFEEGSVASSFSQRSKNRRSPWAELSVLDPTMTGSEASEIAPRLLPATQLLIAYEFRRASALLPAASSHDAKDGDARMRQIFEQVPEGSNSLPAEIQTSRPIGAILLIGDPNKGVGTLQLALIEYVQPQKDWKASFLHRSDTRSEIYAIMLDLDEDKKVCQPQRKESKRGIIFKSAVLCPCHFVCRVEFTTFRSGNGPRKFAISDEGLKRFQGMRRYLEDLASVDIAKSTA